MKPVRGISSIRKLPPVCDGMVIIVQGNILPDAKMLEYKLCTGPNYEHCDTAVSISLHCNNKNIIVRNSFINGSWGLEECDGPSFNIPCGQPVECIMLITNECIKVAFNGQHYCDYHHRIPKEHIAFIVICGDIQFQDVTVYGPSLSMGAYGNYGMPTPLGGASTAPGLFTPASSHNSHMPYQQHCQVPGSLCTPPRVTNTVQSGCIAPVQPHLNMSRKQMIPGGLYTGRLVYISCIPGPSQFIVNLRNDESRGNIAFHFNPRLQYGVVVRNSFIGGSWGMEESDKPSFPFVAGQRCQIIILCEYDRFKVAVDEQHYIEFRHRDLNLYAIQWVEVLLDALDVQIQVT